MSTPTPNPTWPAVTTAALEVARWLDLVEKDGDLVADADLLRKLNDYRAALDTHLGR